MNSDTIIDVSGVSVRYQTSERPTMLRDYFVNLGQLKRMNHGSFLALDDVSLYIKKGESLGIIGSNGAGKSTLLKAIAGVIEPTKGEVTVRGTIVPLIELGTGFDPELTGRENVYLNASLFCMTKKETDERFERIVEFSELENFIDAPLRTYSSGMTARLAFSIAVEIETEVLIVDEVLSVGDEGFKKKCRFRVDDILKKGVTLLFVSHAMPEVQRLCDNIIWLDGGRIAASGDAELVSRKYLLHVDKTVFEDIQEGHPYKIYIDAMFAMGITNGYDVNGKRFYNPENRISRAEFAIFLSRALGIKKNYTSSPIFMDVPDSHWAGRHIAWVYEQGLIDPVRDNEGNIFYMPDDYVSASDLKNIMSKIDSTASGELLPGGVETVSRGDVARIFYEFFDSFRDL